MPPQTRVNGRPPTSPLGKPDVVWGLPGQGGLLTEWAETVPDLMWPSSIRTYGRMRRDSKISAVLNAFFLPLLRATWAVDPAGVNQAKAVDVVAADLGLPVLGEKGPAPAMSSIRGFHWGEHLRLALLSYVFGFFPFERWYTTKTRDGLTHAAGIEERLPYTIDMIDLADNGQINTVSQNTQLQPIPANRFVWYAHEREGANWTGVSMLRSAYTPWILKHETLRVHATSIRRWGMGIPVVHAPPGGTPGQIAQAQQLASGMRAGDTAGAGLPDGFSFEVAGITGSIPDALGFLNFLNQEIASSALAAMLELGLSTGGSRALGDTFLDMFLLSLQAAANEIGNTASYGVPAMPGISRSLTDINFGEDEPCPRIVATDVGDRHEMTALAIQQLVACGAIQPDDTLEAFLRQEWSFPARTTPRTPPPPPKTPGQPGGAPGGGQPGPAGPPPNPQPPSAQPARPRPPAGPPGRRGGQPAISSAPAAAAAGLRRPMTATEAAAGLDPEAMRAELETATDRVLTQWMPVLTEQRHDLADQVTAAVDDGQLHHLATLAAPGSGGTDVLYRAMSAVAAQAAGRAVAEAAGQGITIDLTDVLIDHARLRQLAAARAALAGQSLAQAAARKALQVVTATAGTDAAREVTAVLHGLSPRSLADQLMAALHTAANEARLAVLAAGPEAVYTATELADDPNCCQPCKDIDGHQFASLDDARNAYANGAYIHCSGGLRCRGTVVATWPHTPLHLDVPGTGETWPHHLTPPPDLDPGVAAGYDPGEARDPHTGKWTSTGDATVHELARSGAHRGGNPASPVAPITAAEARDGSRAVPMDEFQQLAAEGRQHLERLRAHPKDPAGLDRNWDKILDETYAETRKSWGGATIDAHTGQALPQGADKYALTVKPAGLTSVSLPENATQAQFTAAMNEARAKFAGQLTSQQAYLGIFHDDDLNRVDIDPVLVVDTLHEVETIGAYTHAIGGAYKFSDGNGYWPPHVADAPAQVAAAADGKPVPFKGPGQWRTQADEARQAALLRIHQDDGAGEEDDPGPKGDAARAAASTQAAWHFNPFQRRNRHGEWAGEDDTLQAPAAPHEPTADEARALSDDELAGAPGTPAAGERRRRADHSGNYVQLWHGTSRDNARSISRDGMHGTYSQDDPTLSPDRLQSRLLPYELNPDLHWPDNPAAVLDVRVPADQEDEYLYPPHGPIAARALRKPLPPEMIYGHQLEPYNDDGSNPQRAAAEAARGGWDEDRHPRGRGGEWVRLDRAGMDRMLASEFRPQRLEAEQVRHPRSGWMVDAGVERRVSRPDGPAPAGDSLGPEGPATFDLIDHGNPLDPAYNSLAYMAGKRAGTEPIAHVYRGMSADEWDQAQRRGFIQSDKRGDISPREGTNAAADPRDAVSYLPHGPGVLAKIKVRPEDKWFTIGADQYLRTRQRIPLDRVEHTIEIRRGGEYDAEFEARPAQLAHAAFDEAKHPRGWHGRFGHGTGHEALDGGDRRLIADQLAQWAKTEKDSDLKTALGMVSDSYQAGDNHDAAYRLRLAADRARQLGRPGDAGEMTAIAGLIEKIKPAGGGEGYPGQYRDRLGGYWRGETDPDAKQNLNLAGAAYDAGQYDQAADLLRDAAGRVGPLGRTADRDNYNALAGAIEQQGQDNGVSHTTQALNALGTETDATSYGDVADQLSNARRAIDRAQAGTSWRTQAASYLQTAADRANAHRDYAAARRYQNLASRVLRLPDTQAPGNTGLTALVGRAAPAVPRLLGGGDPRWNGKAGTFTPAQQPDYLGFTYPDGRIELRTDVVNGLLDTQAHPDKVMAEPDNLDVMLHELIHDTTGGRTAQDKKDWAALPRDEKNALGAINELDQRGDPSGRGNPVARTASDITRAHLWITRPQLDSLLTRGLMEKTGTSSATGGAPPEPDIRLTAKARRMLGADTTAADSDAYTSVTGHDAEEGFTELGATEHMEQFAGDTGFGQVMTSRLSVTPPGKPPTLNQIYDAQQEVRDLYSAAGKVGNPGTVNGPGSLEAYMALSNADHEISSPEPSPARFAGYLAQAYRAEPDPGVKARIAALNTRLGITGGATIDNPAYAQAKTDLISALRAEQRNLEQDGRPPQAQAARHLAAVITDTENDMPAEVGDVITEIQHLGDRAALAKTLRGKLDTLTATPVLKHDTVPEYARNLADPEKIRTGAGPGAWVNGKEWQGSWGHYPLLTANAQQWVQSAARAEHKTRVDQPGTAGYKRTVELTDEINREGTAGKLTAMTHQVLRSMGIDPDTADPGTLTAVRDEINATYGDPSSPGHGAAAAWKAARRTARRLAPAPRQPAAPRRVSAPLITWKASAAPEDDEPDGVLPVTVTLTTAGAKAERIRAWAWADPRRLPQATAQIRQLATRTTDPAALRQVQDAGRSLAVLTAIRQAPPATAAAWDPGKHPRKGKGEHGGGQFTRDGGTARPARPASSPRPDTVAAALDKALASGVVHEAKPGQDIADPDERRYFGTTADTAIVTYADGSKWVRKRGTRLHPFTSTDVNHEVAYSRLATALGIPAPVAIKHTGADGHPEMYEPYVNGIPAIEWAGGADPAEEAEGEPLAHDPATMYNTPAGRMIGLADQIAGTAERHLGNWLVVGDHPVPIDNNDAGFNPFFGSITEFADYPMTQLAAEHPPAEWAAWQASLERLRPEYTQLGMTSEWRNVMANFAEAKRQAGVT